MTRALSALVGKTSMELESDAAVRCGGRQGDGTDVVSGDGEELATVGDVAVCDALCVMDVHLVEQVCHETGIAPSLLVTLFIALTDDVAVAHPCLTGEVVLVLTVAAATDFEQLRDVLEVGD